MKKLIGVTLEAIYVGKKPVDGSLGTKKYIGYDHLFKDVRGEHLAYSKSRARNTGGYELLPGDKVKIKCDWKSSIITNIDTISIYREMNDGIEVGDIVLYESGEPLNDIRHLVVYGFAQAGRHLTYAASQDGKTCYDYRRTKCKLVKKGSEFETIEEKLTYLLLKNVDVKDPMREFFEKFNIINVNNNERVTKDGFLNSKS